MLHTVNKSPFERESLSTCFRLARRGSDVLLIEDGIYAALSGNRFEPAVREAQARYTIFVLKEDIEARGIEPGALIRGIEIVDYGGFVDLAARNDSVQSWL